MRTYACTTLPRILAGRNRPFLLRVVQVASLHRKCRRRGTARGAIRLGSLPRRACMTTDRKWNAVVRERG